MLKLRLNLWDGIDLTKFLKLVSGEKVQGNDTDHQFIFRKS
jgi:hypothetical protein